MADDFNPDEFLSEIGISPEEADTDTTPIRVLRRKVKELGKQLNEANSTISTFETEKAQSTLKGTWDELGVPEPVREFYRGDQNADAIKSWWDASKGFFNIQGSEQQQQTTEQNPGPAGEQLQGLQQAAAAAALGHDQPAALDSEAFKLAMSEVAKGSAAKNPNALDEALSQFGIRAGNITPPRVG